MHYIAYISKEGRHTLAEFPDCPGCQTFSDGEDLAELAREALQGWLEANLVDGQIPPRPVEHTSAPPGVSVARVSVRARLAAALSIRWARQDSGLSQTALGKLVGVTQQQIAKLENPDENLGMETFEKVGRALNLEVNVGFERREAIVPPAAKARRS